MDKITHEMRLVQWTSIIQECRSSGISVRSWCPKNNINVKQFYYWERKIREEASDDVKKTDSNSQPVFAQLSTPVTVEDSKNTSSFHADMLIHFGNNVLELSNTVSEELLSNVFKVMSYVK